MSNYNNTIHWNFICMTPSHMLAYESLNNILTFFKVVSIAVGLNKYYNSIDLTSVWVRAFGWYNSVKYMQYYARPCNDDD